MNAWLRRIAPVAVTLVLLLYAGALLAQEAPPGQAPLPPGAQEAKPDVGLPGDAAADRKARIEALRDRWVDLAAAAPRTAAPQMIVQGQYIYILYGTILAQLSAETLELKAKVDLRELLMGDRELMKKLRGERPEKKLRLEPPAGEPPAEQ
ncbi:MAG: hypothetical protein FJX75_02205 [Armatimonadetes bacterium]|nr:hypothetical protein [Armatimonadota bacterium]